MYFIERRRFFNGKLIDKTGLNSGSRCIISCKLKKYDDKYYLTLKYNESTNKSMGSSGVLISSVGSYFDEKGVLCYDGFTSDLKKIYDQARSNARKAK
ncbi:unnamed protein product [Rotaria sp. Silwood2]|nr:unnamed protein product [Rotaria sp. Silwood2]CAF2938929.1 unnamed protein product [Rotaria sp. Silwood2]CAF3237159.1 unnamed protein product [Rotaria sp. Silwood2]CAF3317292.1 unnamed protein product [Rotaria sp. Silwood2]CAF4151299.1 unnamed protein product [Rotaria sp. Silwood2]